MHVCPECGAALEEAGYCPHDGTPLRASFDDPLIGSAIGHYRVATLLGIGGMGRVYKGVHPGIGSRVAIKVLSRDCASNRDLVERFFAEARAVNLIRHENIINILDLSELPDRRPYIVMEYLDGMPLSQVFERRGPLPLGTLARLASEVLGALDAAHAKSVIHRDLKPDNIFVTPQGRAKVLDFGIAKLMPEQSGRSGPTQDGSLLGTPHYMAPEQARGRQVDARTDLYAVGVILFEGATGKRPFEAESLFDLLRLQVEEEPLLPRSLRPDLPPAYETIILRAMAKDPEARWQSAGALAGALAQAAGELPPAAWNPVGIRESGPGLGPEPVRTPPQATPDGPTAGRSLPTPPGSGEVAPSPAPAPAPAKRTWPLAALLLLALGGGAAAVGIAISRGGAGGEVEVAGANEADAAPASAPEADEEGKGTPEAAPQSEPAAGAEPEPEPEQEDEPEPKEETQPREQTQPNQEPKPADESPAVSEAGDDPLAHRYEPTPNPEAFDVTGFLPEARKRARRAFPDAVLIRIDAEGVYPNGKANLTLDDDNGVLYRFASPSRARRPDDLPLGVEHKPTCKYYVSVEADQITSYALEGWACDEPLIGPPACTGAQIWDKAAARGAPRENAVGELGYWAGPGGKGRWHFQIGRAHSRFYPDDC